MRPPRAPGPPRRPRCAQPRILLASAPDPVRRSSPWAPAAPLASTSPAFTDRPGRARVARPGPAFGRAAQQGPAAGGGGLGSRTEFTLGALRPSPILSTATILRDLTMPVQIYILCSPKDSAHRFELEKRLAPHPRLFSYWSTANTSPGNETAREAEQQLGNSQLAVWLISADFRFSEEQGTEAHRALELERAGTLRIIPVLIRSTTHFEAPYGERQVLPDNGSPVSTWPDSDAAWRNVVAGIRRVAERIAGTNEGPSPSSSLPHAVAPGPSLAAALAQTRTAQDIVGVNERSSPPSSLPQAVASGPSQAVAPEETQAVQDVVGANGRPSPSSSLPQAVASGPSQAVAPEETQAAQEIVSANGRPSPSSSLPQAVASGPSQVVASGPSPGQLIGDGATHQTEGLAIGGQGYRTKGTRVGGPQRPDSSKAQRRAPITIRSLPGWLIGTGVVAILAIAGVLLRLAYALTSEQPGRKEANTSVDPNPVGTGSDTTAAVQLSRCRDSADKILKMYRDCGINTTIVSTDTICNGASVRTVECAASCSDKFDAPTCRCIKNSASSSCEAAMKPYENCVSTCHLSFMLILETLRRHK